MSREVEQNRTRQHQRTQQHYQAGIAPLTGNWARSYSWLRLVNPGLENIHRFSFGGYNNSLRA